MMHMQNKLPAGQVRWRSAQTRVNDYVKADSMILQIHHMFAANTKEAPTVKFVGVFDTVKAVNDEFLHDLSFNGSIQHLRHALAMNEERERFDAEYIYPNFNHPTSSLFSRSFVQAWFVGAHIDMGGSAVDDGLSLYPLQWMITESKELGLCFRFVGSYGGRSTLPNPLGPIGLDGEDEKEAGAFTTENKVLVRMYDIRTSHTGSDGQGREKSGYKIKINKDRALPWKRRKREVFDHTGYLRGYCPFGKQQDLPRSSWVRLLPELMKLLAPQGTIIHPSVYMLMDVYNNIGLDIGAGSLRTSLAEWRHEMLGPDLGFWNNNTGTDLQEPGAIRILVCGNTGVGKSTLINKVFGVPVTNTSNRTRGVHNVETEITWDDRPDLIIHDSGGFEAGGDHELEAVERFLRDKSNEIEINKRLHIIW
jgi:hypothetical protein